MAKVGDMADQLNNLQNEKSGLESELKSIEDGRSFYPYLSILVNKRIAEINALIIMMRELEVKSVNT